MVRLPSAKNHFLALKFIQMNFGGLDRKCVDLYKKHAIFSLTWAKPCFLLLEIFIRFEMKCDSIQVFLYHAQDF